MTDLANKARSRRIDAIARAERSRANIFFESRREARVPRHSVLAELSRMNLRIAPKTPAPMRIAA